MVKFTTNILKFNENKGEKSGWTYIEIPSEIAQKLKPNNKKSFRVKGKLDNFAISQVAIMPMGDGSFILAINAEMRKGISKNKGESISVQLAIDNSPFIFDNDLIECLNEDVTASTYFKTLTPSHQKYFSKWIESAKTIETKVKRITLTLNALSKKMTYPEMLREQTAKNKLGKV